MGPGAGVHGGRVMAQGTPQEVADNPDSLTGRYLSDVLRIEVPRKRRPATGFGAAPFRLGICGARGNNLRGADGQGVDVEIPVGLLTCVTGVSGSGKAR
jgi:excinuclease ABC subunit A